MAGLNYKTTISQLEEPRKGPRWSWALCQYRRHPAEWYRYRKRLAQSLGSLNFDVDGLDISIDTIFRLGCVGTHEWPRLAFPIHSSPPPVSPV